MKDPSAHLSKASLSNTLDFTPEDYEEIAEQRRAAYGGLLEWSEIIAVYAAKELKARGFLLTEEQEKLAKVDMHYLGPSERRRSP